jgi:zinc/manganese transport system permease protein
MSSLLGAHGAWLLAPAAALLAACLVLVPLGTQVLGRGVVFIDLAVAQVAACGALAAGLLIDHPDTWTTAAASAGAALCGAGFVRWLARRRPADREALIGLVYVAGASASVLAASFDPHGRERMAALLAADVLWAGWPAIAVLAGAAVVVMCLAWGRGRLLRQDRWFYPVFALSLSAAVPVLGLYLVFALLIGPAIWARRGMAVHRCLGLAMAACGIGVAASALLDWPSGACVAAALCALGLAAALPARRAGD